MAGPALVQAVEGQTGECAAQHPRKNSNFFFFLYRWENREILKDNDVTVCGEWTQANASFIGNKKIH